MPELAGFPYCEAMFNKGGDLQRPDQVTLLQQELGSVPGADLLVLAHGWNNDIDDARRLYTGLLAELRTAMDSGRIAGTPESIVVLAVFWPSKKFIDEEVSVGPAAGYDSPLANGAVIEQIDQLKAAVEDVLAAEKLELAKALVPKLEHSPKAQADFADLIRSMIPTNTITEKGEEDEARSFFELDGNDLMDRLAKPVDRTIDLQTSRASETEVMTDGIGGAAGLGDFFTGMKSAARNLLNYSTYYLMKGRSGSVGLGLNAMLRDLRETAPDQKIHLVGHSFGARLVTAATAGKDPRSSLTVQSMVLLQAAFSHNAFAVNFDGKGKNGAFRRVLEDKLVQGPILISHTVNDTAVGLAYPLASLISGADAAELGDADDPYGGLGRNGAQHTPEAIAGTLLSTADTYNFTKKTIYNLRADSVIADHGNIVHPEVAHAMLSAIL